MIRGTWLQGIVSLYEGKSRALHVNQFCPGYNACGVLCSACCNDLLLCSRSAVCVLMYAADCLLVTLACKCVCQGVCMLCVGLAKVL